MKCPVLTYATRGKIDDFSSVASRVNTLKIPFRTDHVDLWEVFVQQCNGQRSFTNSYCYKRVLRTMVSCRYQFFEIDLSLHIEVK